MHAVPSDTFAFLREDRRNTRVIVKDIQGEGTHQSTTPHRIEHENSNGLLGGLVSGEVI